MRSENLPENDPGLPQFPNRNGVPFTYTLNNGPYEEGSIGIANIFKVLRVDYARRFSYLDHPFAPKQGIRVFIIVQF